MLIVTKYFDENNTSPEFEGEGWGGDGESVRNIETKNNIAERKKID